MPFNSIFSWLIGKRMARINECRENPFASQLSVFKYLISEGKTTEFGYKNQFNSISSYADYSNIVPLQEYGTLKHLIDRSIDGEENLLWPGKTNWFAKSSGTTADRVKILPVTSNSLSTIFKAVRGIKNKSSRPMVLIEANPFFLTSLLMPDTIP